MAEFQFPTEYEIEDITLAGVSVLGLFVSIEIYESIYIGGVTGSIVIYDTDSVNFVDTYSIEFMEEIEISVVGPNNEELNFSGYMSGLRDEVVKQQKKYYTIDFCSKTVRKNEMTFVTKAFKNEKPESIAQQMAERLESKVETKSTGEPMTFSASRWKPLQVMKKVMSRGVTQDSNVSVTENTQEETSGGTSGFYFWETIDGFRFASGDDLKNGAFKTWDGFQMQIANRSLTLEQSRKGVIDYEFPQMGNFQSKLQSGAYKSVHVSFDMDKGEYKEVFYIPDENIITPKQNSYLEGPTRYLYKIFQNEKFSDECEKTNENVYDQSRKFLQQSIASQNTMADQHGRFTLSNHFLMRAGDLIEFKFTKISCGSEYENKHTGAYVIKQVGHHIFSDRKAYTKISTIRTSTELNDEKTKKSGPVSLPVIPLTN